MENQREFWVRCAEYSERIQAVQINRDDSIVGLESELALVVEVIEFLDHERADLDPTSALAIQITDQLARMARIQEYVSYALYCAREAATPPVDQGERASIH